MASLEVSFLSSTIFLLAIDVVIAAAFVGFGYLSSRADISAFLVGLVVYVIDGLLYLGLMILGRTPAGIVAIIWHGVAIYFIWKGLQAARELKNLPLDGPSYSVGRSVSDAPHLTNRQAV